MSRYVGGIVSSLLVGAWIADDGSRGQRALLVAAVACSVALLWSSRIPRPVSADEASGIDEGPSGNVRART